MSDLKRTPIYSWHEQNGGKLVPFAGWSLPIQYTSMKDEHLCVRSHVGLFDVSHMGEFRCKGPNSLSTLEWLTTNAVRKLEPGKAHYTLLTNKEGGIVDDLIIYCLEKESDYLLCVNAANIEKDWSWVTSNNKGADWTNESDHWAQIAVQGPKSEQLLLEIFPEYNLPSPFSIQKIPFNTYNALISTTGYTGEKGVEIFIETKGALPLWERLISCGAKYSCQPIGLGARDSLRTEKGYSLYGHEIDDTTNPYAARLGWVVKPKEKDFIGAELITKGKENLTHKLIGFELIDRGVPRQGYKLFSFDNQEVGWVTSGTHSPSLNRPVGMAYIKSDLSEVGAEFEIDIRNKRVKAIVRKLPLV